MANLWTGSHADDSSLHSRQDVGPRQHGQVSIFLLCLLSLVGSVLGHLVHFNVEWCANDCLFVFNYYRTGTLHIALLPDVVDDFLMSVYVLAVLWTMTFWGS